MPHVIEFDGDACELHVSINDHDAVVLATRMKHSDGKPRTQAELTAQEARLLAGSLIEMAEHIEQQETERQLSAGLDTLTNRK